MYLLTTFIAITAILFIVGFLKDQFGKDWYSSGGDEFYFWGRIAFVITIIAILLIPICRYYSGGRIAEYKTRQATIERQRKSDISEIERATLTKEILDCNAWLSDCKYALNNRWFNVYYDKEILNLEPIE